MKRVPREGDTYTDVITPARLTPNRDAIVAAIDSLKSAMFHLKQSNLDEEGRLGRAQVKATLINLSKRLEVSRQVDGPVATVARQQNPPV